MAGHLGNATRTTQNLTVVRVDAERQLLMVKGAVPGFSGRDVIVRTAVKGQRKVVAQKPAAEQKSGSQKPAQKPAAKA
jgi:large subunit ribosomal protein L3